MTIPKDELQELLNVVYEGAVKECEAREFSGALKGNGHHMAQTIVANVEALLRGRKMVA